MSRTIHKYALGPGANSVPTYERARFLHVHTQGGEPVLWADVNTLERECLRTVVTVPTGGEVPWGGIYLGTAVDVASVLVFHVYLMPEGTAAECLTHPHTVDGECVS